MMFKELVACIKVDGKIMREIDNNIYIPFGTDFSIFLKNLSSKKVQINIDIDGDDILEGNSLLLDGYQEMNLLRWLKGGLNSGPKLKFVEKTEEIRETRPETGMDGIVSIRYRYEQKPLFHNSPHYLMRTWPVQQIFYNQPEYYGSGTPVTPDVTYTAGSDIHLSNDEPVAKSGFQNEDGMTVMGDEVQQEFNEGSIGALELNEHTICFILKGDVNKPLTVKTKIICGKCKNKNKSSNKFCTQCGNNLKYN